MTGAEQIVVATGRIRCRTSGVGARGVLRKTKVVGLETYPVGPWGCPPALIEQHGRQPFEAQAIPMDAALLDLDSYKAFLIERRKQIAAQLNRFTEQVDYAIRRSRVRRLARETAQQRLEPFTDGGRTHGECHQADIRFGGRRQHERQQCEGQLTSTSRRCGPAASDRSRQARWTRIDPNQPAELLQSGPTLGPISLEFCVHEAAVRGHRDPARSWRRYVNPRGLVVVRRRGVGRSRVSPRCRKC